MKSTDVYLVKKNKHDNCSQNIQTREKVLNITKMNRIWIMTTNSPCNKTVIQSFRLKQTIGIAILS